MSPIASVDDTEMTREKFKRMKQEILRLQEENEILKKAINSFPSSWRIDCRRQSPDDHSPPKE